MLKLYHNQLTQTNKKNILLIGSGLMAEAVIDHLLKRNENFIHIASALDQEAKALAAKKQRCQAHHLDVTNIPQLRQFVKAADIVVAYIPPQFIAQIAKVCVDEGKSMVTSQYTFPEIRALHEEAKKKGILILNELGLDPGIDHLATIKVRDEVHAKGGKIIEYESWCGGVPSPEFCNNPLGYKFSWSPFAAIRNVNNDAKYLENGQLKYLSGADLLYSTEEIHVNPALQMEAYPNRDSIPYKELYGLKDCQKLIRGTLRYPGHCALMGALKALGLAQEVQIDAERDMNWYEYILHNLRFESCVSQRLPDYYIPKLANTIISTIPILQIETLLVKAFNKIFNQFYYSKMTEEQLFDEAEKITYTLKWLGIFDPSLKIMRNVTHVHNFAAHLQTKMNYLPGETDLVAMQHIFKIVYPNDPRVHTRKSTMVKIGTKNGKTAMALTVGVPTAVGVQCILDKKIPVTGVHMPNMAEINNPILEELTRLGIYCEEIDY